MYPANLFEAFDDGDIAAAAQQIEDNASQRVKSRSLITTAKHQTRRVESLSKVAELVPARIDVGTSVHVFSSGDIDTLTYVDHLLADAEFFDLLCISTWWANRPDLEQIRAWLDAGLVEEFHAVFDERFERLGSDQYELAQQIVTDFGGSVSAFKNHSKLILARNASQSLHYCIESSANICTTKRLENTTITNDPNLFNFIAQLFHEIRHA